MDPAPAVAMEAAAAPAGEVERVDAPAVRAPRRVVPEAFWEFMVLDDASNKSNLSEDDIAGLMLCVAEWSPCGATTSNNLCGLLKGDHAAAWFHFGYHSRLKVKYMGTFGDSLALFQMINQNHPPIVARQVVSKVFNIETDLVPPQNRYQDPFVSLRVYNMAGVEVLTFEFAFRPCTLGHTVLGAVARHLNLSKLQKSKLVLLRKDVKLKPGMTMRSWAPEHFVFEAKGSTVSLKRKLEEAGA